MYLKLKKTYSKNVALLLNSPCKFHHNDQNRGYDNELNH